jgi:hypothetical protein
MSDLDCLFRSMSDLPAALAERFAQEMPDVERARSLARLLGELVGGARWSACRIGAAHAVSPEVHAGGDSLSASFRDDLGRDGALTIGVAEGASAPFTAAVAALLALAAPLVGLHLQVEARRREERESQIEAVAVGDAVLGMTHDLNNHLNTMVLQASVVQIQVDDELREELAVIRREGNAIAARLRLLQEFRERSRSARVRVDLHELLGRAAGLVPSLCGRLAWKLAERLPAVATQPAPLLRLLSGCLRLMDDLVPTGLVLIRTAPGDATVEIAFGPLPDVKIERLAELFQQESNLRRDRELHGLAAESLVRLLAADWRFEGGELVLQWKCAD